MTNKRAAPKQVVPTPVAPARSGWRTFLLQQAAGYAVSPLLRFAAAFPLGLAIVLLSAGWLVGPQRFVDAWRFHAYTASAEGRIVDSWLALEFDPVAQGDRGNWAGAARATHCAVVAYEGDWGAPQRRAFCGNRLDVHGEETLPMLVDDTTMAPGVPFAMPRDERGFALPQVRIGGAEAAWLKAHPPFSGFDERASRTAWDALVRRLDRPLDHALAGWGTPPPAFPLSLDPRVPGEAMPAAFVAARRGTGNPGALPSALLLLGAGVWLWLLGMRTLMFGLPRTTTMFAAALPLLLLPWWGERMPRALARVQPQVAEVIGDMLADLDVTGRLVASSPGAAQLAHGGERLTWRVGDGTYAETIGRMAFAAPSQPPADADAALRRLAEIVAAQVRAFDAAERAALFDRLAADKVAGRYGAGLLFLPVAREIAFAGDPRSADALAAAGFLDVWVTQPVEEPWRDDAGFRARIEAWRSLLDAPEPSIANRARWIVERAENSR
jgi:hypothetical protein